MAKLNAKQQRFCDEYLIDLNTTQAAVRAGYSVKTAEQIGYQLLQKTSVKEYLATRQQERILRTETKADYVLNRLRDIDNMDVIDILSEDGTLKPIKDWPRVWRISLSGMDVAELFEGGGDERVLAGLLKKIKWPDKLKNLELLGKHIAVGAFKDSVQHEHSFTGPDGKPLSVSVSTVYVSVGDKRNG